RRPERPSRPAGRGGRSSRLEKRAGIRSSWLLLLGPLETGERRGQCQAVVERVQIERQWIVVDELLQGLQVVAREHVTEETLVHALRETRALRGTMDL